MSLVRAFAVATALTVGLGSAAPAAGASAPARPGSPPCPVQASALTVSRPVVNAQVPKPFRTTLRAMLPGPVTAASAGWSEKGLSIVFSSQYVVARGQLLHVSSTLDTGLSGHGEFVGEQLVRVARVGAAGWGPMRSIQTVDPAPPTFSHEPIIFALNRNGTIHRYRFRSRGLRSDGTAPGFLGTLGFTLVAQSKQHAVFLTNSTSGRLATVTVPLSGPMTATTTILQPRGWSGFDQLVARTCGRGWGVLGVDSTTNTARLYRLGRLAGPKTTVISDGRVPGDWESGPVVRWRHSDPYP